MNKIYIPLISLFVYFCIIAIGFAGAHILVSLSEDKGRGVLWHKGLKKYNPRLLLLVQDMANNPDNYKLDQYTLESATAYLWTGSGWAYYRDYDDHPWVPKARVRIGPLSIFDRNLLKKALKKLAGTKPQKAPIPFVAVEQTLDLELALRRQNGLIK